MQIVDDTETLTFCLILIKAILEVQLSLHPSKPVLRNDFKCWNCLEAGLDSVLLNYVEKDFIKLDFILFMPLSFPSVFKWK